MFVKVIFLKLFYYFVLVYTVVYVPANANMRSVITIAVKGNKISYFELFEHSSKYKKIREEIFIIASVLIFSINNFSTQNRIIVPFLPSKL